MGAFLKNVRGIAISGFFALFPICVLLIVITKVWVGLSSVGAKFAAMFGLKSFLGVGGTTVFSGLLLIAIWIISGLLMRSSFMAGLSRALERGLAKHIPGDNTYKEMAEERLQHKVRVLLYASASISWQEYWQPGYVVEQDDNGNCVVFLPDIPETTKGHLVLATKDQVRLVSSITATNSTRL